MSTIWIAAAIVGIIVLRKVSRIAGAIFAMLVSLGIAAWGTWIYKEGGGIAFAGTELPQQAFYVIVAIWFALESYGLVRAIRQRPSPERDDSEE